MTLQFPIENRMMTHPLKTIRSDYWFYAFICIHVIAWTMAPTFVRFTLPMDSMEGALWGQQLEWGYDKNPFMNGWLTALALHISEQSAWVVYLFSQISVAICFWAVWQLGKKMLLPVHALLAVLLLEGVQYYNFHAIDFNDNTLELATWALTTLFFYQALRENKYRDWLFTGLFAGLAMMTKYYSAMLLFSMALLLFFNKESRQAFKKPPLYIGLIVFLIIITPHILWLSKHDFVTINYALNRVSNEPTWLNHLFFPAQFAWQSIEAFLPAFFLMLFLLIGKNSTDTPVKINHHFDKLFLAYVGLGPFLLTILLSVLTGITLRAAWGQPLLSLWGIILILWLQPNVTPERFYRFVIVLFSLLAIAVMSYCIALTRADEPSSANYPGKNIATTLTQIWHTKYHTPLNYIAGSRWIAGNIALYSNDHPKVYVDWDKKISPWINEATLQREGAIFVWDLNRDEAPTPQDIMARFNKLSTPQLMHFSWLRNKHLAPIEILVAFLPPQLS